MADIVSNVGHVFKLAKRTAWSKVCSEDIIAYFLCDDDDDDDDGDGVFREDVNGVNHTFLDKVSVLTHLFVHLVIWTKYKEITGEDYIYQLQIGLFFLISCVTWTKYLDYE